MNPVTIPNDDMKPTHALRFIPLVMLAAMGIVPAVSVDAVYFGQTHLHQPDHPYFGLVGSRNTLIKAHVTDPAMPASPAVTAVLNLGGQTLNLPLSGPATLPASIPDGLGVVQHSLSDTFTATIPASWIKTGLQVTVNAGAASVSFTDMKVGAPTKVVMTMFDVNYLLLLRYGWVTHRRFLIGRDAVPPRPEHVMGMR